MKPRQKIFADEYLVDFNATRAYKSAYQSVKNNETAAVNASKLLRTPNVAAYIQKKMGELEKRTEITQSKVLLELARIGFSNITDFIEIQNVEGEAVVAIKPTNQLTDSQKSAISSIKEGANGIEIKLNDKVKALELLGKHVGIFSDKVNLDVDLEINIAMDYGSGD